MSKQDFDIKKYPKSKNNFQCLGPCYYPNTMVVHPTQLEIVTDYTQPFCPVDEWQHVDKKTGKTTDTLTDICLNPTEKTNISNKELELNILTPYIDFNLEHFLKIYYNIFSFEDSIEWIDKNKYSSLGTKTRIINASLKTFGEQIDIFDNRFSDFFIEYIKKYEIKNLYNKLNKNIGISSDKNILLVNESNLSISNYCVERTNYIIKTFLEKDDITKFLVRYFKHRKSQWTNINNHLENMSIDFSDYVHNKIIMTL